MKVLLLGATGPTGGHVLAHALEAGNAVSVLARRPEALTAIKDRITIFQGDATSVDDVARAAEGQDAVIAALGRGSSLRPEGLFTGSARAVVEAMTRAGVKRLVWLSSYGVGETIRTASPLQRLMYRTVLRSTYADKAIGRWAGFTIGWLYWWFWALLMAWEAYVAGMILNTWFPDISVNVFTLVATFLLISINFMNVRNYGEFEFWFALIKVTAIVCFIIICLLAVLNIWQGGTVHGIANLTAHGGFMPNGWSSVIVAMLGVMFAFLGAEIVTIAASESANPAEQIVKATNSVVWRICLFYIGSMFRYDRPQAGRMREFHQFGVEALGEASPAVDAEIIVLAVEFLRALGLQELKLHLNSVGCPKCRPVYREKLQEFFRPHLEELCTDCRSRFERNPLRLLDCKKVRTPCNHSANRSVIVVYDRRIEFSQTERAHGRFYIRLLSDRTFFQRNFEFTCHRLTPQLVERFASARSDGLCIEQMPDRIESRTYDIDGRARAERFRNNIRRSRSVHNRMR